MKVSDFHYDLPEELIAQEPMPRRDTSRLMVVDRENGTIENKLFKDILEYINPGDCLVLNDTKVIPARLIGQKEDSGGKIEFVLLSRKQDDIWEVILKPGRRAKVGSRFSFGENLCAEVLEVVDGGNRLVKFEYQGIFEEILDKVGIMPLPPYITKELDDSSKYQTVYALNNGSAAAPTAGLHFTDELLDSISKKGVKIAKVTLHIGLGTFRPVKTESIFDHKMHSEFYTIDQVSCDTINSTKKNGGSVIAVGTTSCRVLETVATESGEVKPTEGWTDIFIYPGYRFKIVDKIITNFHLPESTLIMLVSAFAGKDLTFKAYEKAVKDSYRFFSFGDAMFIK